MSNIEHLLKTPMLSKSLEEKLMPSFIELRDRYGWLIQRQQWSSLCEFLSITLFFFFNFSNYSLMRKKYFNAGINKDKYIVAASYATRELSAVKEKFQSSKRERLILEFLKETDMLQRELWFNDSSDSFYEIAWNIRIFAKYFSKELARNGNWDSTASWAFPKWKHWVWGNTFCHMRL